MALQRVLLLSVMVMAVAGQAVNTTAASKVAVNGTGADAAPKAGAAAAADAAVPAAPKDGAPITAPKDAAPSRPAATAAPAAPAAPAAEARSPVPKDSRFAAMVQKVDELKAVCKKLAQKWECNAGTHRCSWDPSQTPSCVVPDGYVKARLIESVPCPGSLMERWFACTAANNDKGVCLSMKSSCTWTDWANYTSLPLPTKHRRLLMADPEAEPGACQLKEVYEQRMAQEWDALSTLSFQISHLDTKVWGSCSTVGELKALVPPSARQPCSVSRTKQSCAIAAPLCTWTPSVAPKDLPLEEQRKWPNGTCEVTCNSTDRATCDTYEECGWDPTANRCAVNDGSLQLLTPADALAKEASANATDAAAAEGPCGSGNVTCNVRQAIEEAAASLTDEDQRKGGGAPAAAAVAEEGPDAHILPPPADLKNGAAGRGGAAAAAAAAALGLAAAALLL